MSHSFHSLNNIGGWGFSTEVFYWPFSNVSGGCTNWWRNCCSQSNVGAFDFRNRLGIQFHTENSFANFFGVQIKCFCHNCRAETCALPFIAGFLHLWYTSIHFSFRKKTGAFSSMHLCATKTSDSITKKFDYTDAGIMQPSTDMHETQNKICNQWGEVKTLVLCVCFNSKHLYPKNMRAVSTKSLSTFWPVGHK